MFPPVVGCLECQQPMEEVDHKLVPVKEIKLWANRAGGILETKGWFWCKKCNAFLHLPTLEEIPIGL